MKFNLLKKLLSVSLITMFLFSFNVIPADAVPCYNVTSGVLDDYAQMCTGDVVIDDSVTSIGGEAFEGNMSITSVIIGSSVTFIDEDAFRSTSITSVTIPNSVTLIDANAFRYTQLTSVTIPSSVTDIRDNAFGGNSSLTSVTFLGNAPEVDPIAFNNVAAGAIANVPYNATGFPPNGSTWNGLIVSYGAAPAGDSDDSGSPSPSVITPVIVEAPDAVFNLKNKKYLSKYAMKIELRKNRSFKRNPEDLYKYEIFKSSKKTCTIIGNYVTRLKKTGTCDFYATRTTAKGKKYKYWVQINYTK